MTPAYKTIRVTITPLDGERHRSRIDEPGSSASFGSGEEFELPPQAIADLIKAIDADDATRSQIQVFGKKLFDAAFVGSVRDKYYAAAAVAKSEDRKLRLCFSVLSRGLFSIPWEYLHDRSGFVLDHGHSIVRVLDELSGSKTSFAPVQNLLCLAASPRGRAQFDAVAHLADLKAGLQNVAGLNVATVPDATIDAVHHHVTTGAYDMIYFVGHGEASGDGGALLCVGPDGAAQRLKAHQLATWIRDTPVRFVFLNSCSTSAVKSLSLHPFAGIAQQIMLDGEIAGVAAMQIDVPIVESLAMASKFFIEIKGKSPEDAMLACRTHATDGFSFGIPVLYSYLDAPAQWEASRIRAFFSADEDSRYALLLPRFFLGRLQPPARRRGKNREYVYPGETFARSDMQGAWYVIELLLRVTSLDRTRLLSYADAPAAEESHLFLFGSQSNPIVTGVLRQTARFKFDYQNKKGYWRLKDTRDGTEFRVRAPYLLDTGEFEKVDDYGVIEKIVDRANRRVYFVIAGFGDRATLECAYYLTKNWQALLDQFGREPFQITLKVPGSMPAHSIERIT